MSADHATVEQPDLRPPYDQPTPTRYVGPVVNEIQVERRRYR